MNKYGPNSAQVEIFIDRLKVVSVEEVKTLIARLAVQDTTRAATREAALDAIWSATRTTARRAAWSAAREATWDVPRAAAWSATAIVVMDLVTEEQFTILTEPFAEILAELGIVWGAK
jgi:hypothetical protein